MQKLHHQRRIWINLNATRSKRAMKRNAKLGYSNGGSIPFGYRSITADQMGDKIKKQLAIEPAEAEIVRCIFRLAQEGDGQSGPMGTKRIAIWLNERGYRSRKGNLFGVGTIHEILTREAYTGIRRFNEFNVKSKRPNAPDQVEIY
jgi:site-specific DNA recombinase